MKLKNGAKKLPEINNRLAQCHVCTFLLIGFHLILIINNIASPGSALEDAADLDSASSNAEGPAL